MREHEEQGGGKRHSNRERENTRNMAEARDTVIESEGKSERERE